MLTCYTSLSNGRFCAQLLHVFYMFDTYGLLVSIFEILVVRLQGFWIVFFFHVYFLVGLSCFFCFCGSLYMFVKWAILCSVVTCVFVYRLNLYVRYICLTCQYSRDTRGSSKGLVYFFFMCIFWWSFIFFFCGSFLKLSHYHFVFLLCIIGFCGINGYPVYYIFNLYRQSNFPNNFRCNDFSLVTTRVSSDVTASYVNKKGNTA